MSLIQTIHLTMGNYKSPMVVPAVQNDTDRQLKMIVDDFTLSNSMTGKMTFKRPDGTFYEADATLALADNAFVAELDQALTCPGRTLAQLKVTATDTVSTFTFIVWVEADTSGTLSPQEGISLSEAVQRAEDAADRAEAAAEGGTGLTDNVKQALLQIARKVAYIDAHGQDYYDDLYDALYEVTGLTLDVSSISLGTIGATSQITATTVPAGAAVTWVSSDTSVATVVNGLVTAVGYGSATITASAGNLTAQCSVVIAQATVTSISAVYTPSGSIYETDIPALDTLKNDLVVTAHWSNGTTSTVTDYALSGTLSAGSNTVTVSYGGQTTTITVTVVALSSISAVYTQSGTVYTTTSLDDLKADLVVTATFADSTTQTVTGYTLSGTLTEGTSTITVSYAGKTTTFNVTVTETALYPIRDISEMAVSSDIKLSVSNGNHIVLKTTSNSRTCYIYSSYVKPTYNPGFIANELFSLPAGATYEIKVKNISYTGNTVASNNFVGLRANASDSSGTTVATSGSITIANAGDGTLSDVTNTATLETDSVTNIGSIAFFVYRPVTLEFDIELRVNGVRYI